MEESPSPLRDHINKEEIDPYSDGPEPSYNLELPFPREDPGGKRKPFFKTMVGKGSEVKLRKSRACNLAYGFCESPP